MPSLKLSVALCTYNGAAYLPAQLASIAAQTRPPDELVVCDDGSADQTRQVVAAFAVEAPFAVRLHVNPTNLGSTRTFERAIGLCDGDVIALADQDDVWRPDKLARMDLEFAAAPDVGLVFSDAELVDEALRPMGRRLSEVFGSDRASRTLRRRETAVNLLVPGWLVTGATMAFRTEFRSLALPIPSDIPMIHDGWIALVVSTMARVSFIAEPLILYRQHTGQQIGARRQKGVSLARRATLRHIAAYEDSMRIVDRARERLRLAGAPETTPGLRELDTIALHLRARRYLPSGRLRRLPLVLRELLTWRYHRYGKGLLSAAKDFASRA
jgi:glycosyltransferase involved in cell wall biosynthesis